MSHDFKVSVITPVYNAERFLRRCVESSLELDSVGEVILVEDGSPDNALRICQELVRLDSRVRLYRHPNGENRGAGASRNLGIEKARCEYVAFADADDYYLPNRFEKDKELFANDPLADGVYGATNTEYVDQAGREKFLANLDAKLEECENLTLSAVCPPEELLSVWLCQHPKITGVFSTDAITVKREFFNRSGVFNERLKLQQDTDLFIRFAAVGRLLAGSITQPVARRSVHESNRMSDMNSQRVYAAMRLEHLRSWFKTNVKNKEYRTAFLRHYWTQRMLRSQRVSAVAPTIALTRLLGWREVTKPYGIFDIGMTRILGIGPLSTRIMSAKRRFFGAFLPWE